MPSPGVDLATAEAELDRVLAEFLEQGPDPAALERIRDQVRAAEIYARDNGTAWRASTARAAASA